MSYKLSSSIRPIHPYHLLSVWYVRNLTWNTEVDRGPFLGQHFLVIIFFGCFLTQSICAMTRGSLWRRIFFPNVKKLHLCRLDIIFSGFLSKSATFESNHGDTEFYQNFRFLKKTYPNPYIRFFSVFWDNQFSSWHEVDYDEEFFPQI